MRVYIVPDSNNYTEGPIIWEKKGESCNSCLSADKPLVKRFATCEKSCFISRCLDCIKSEQAGLDSLTCFECGNPFSPEVISALYKQASSEETNPLSKKKCLQCFSESPSKFYQLKCNHVLCNDCFECLIIYANVTNGTVMCPVCERTIDYKLLEDALPVTAHEMHRRESLSI